MKKVILLLLLVGAAGFGMAQSNSLHYQSVDRGSFTTGGYSATARTQNFIVNTWYSDPAMVSVHYQGRSGMPSGFIFQVCGTLQISANGDLRFCEGDSVALSVMSGFQSYQWSNGISGPNTQAKESGNYFVLATDATGCTYRSDTIAVQVDPTPEPIINRIGESLVAGLGVGDSIIPGLAEEFQWLLNASPLPGSTDSVLMPPQSGIYQVKIVDKNGCEGLSDTVIVVLTDIGKWTAETQIKLFPNPVQKQLTLSIKFARHPQLRYELRNHLGQMIFAGEETLQQDLRKAFELSSLPEGAYVLRIWIGAAPYVFHVIKL